MIFLYSYTIIKAYLMYFLNFISLKKISKHLFNFCAFLCRIFRSTKKVLWISVVRTNHTFENDMLKNERSNRTLKFKEIYRFLENNSKYRKYARNLFNKKLYTQQKSSCVFITWSEALCSYSRQGRVAYIRGPEQLARLSSVDFVEKYHMHEENA